MGKPPFGSIVHIEMYSEQPEETRRFYRDVFGWTFQTIPGAGYDLVTMPARPNGGLLGRPKGGKFQPPATLNYVLVESVDDVAKKIEKSGGKLLKPRYEVPGVGWFAVFEAPGGIVMNVFEAVPGSPLMRP